jgi:hypothetical protein
MSAVWTASEFKAFGRSVYPTELMYPDTCKIRPKSRRNSRRGDARVSICGQPRDAQPERLPAEDALRIYLE